MREDWITEGRGDRRRRGTDEADEDDRRFERNGDWRVERNGRGGDRKLGERVSGCDFVSELGLVCLYT